MSYLCQFPDILSSVKAVCAKAGIIAPHAGRSEAYQLEPQRDSRPNAQRLSEASTLGHNPAQRALDANFAKLAQFPSNPTLLNQRQK
ncbi:MAG: hypothetical protein JWN25_1462 [Verrucomicrobiales bacterium]|nr:hypothetical protein [Verrucomicrobiales bacterium]